MKFRIKQVDKGQIYRKEITKVLFRALVAFRQSEWCAG